MSLRKTTLPPKSHIEIARAVTSAVAAASASDLESMPAKVRESLDYFDEVSQVAHRIETEQPQTLTGFREEMIEVLVAAGEVMPESAAVLVDALAGSHVLARLIAEVASGDIEPVAVAAKAPAKKTTTKRTRKPAHEESTAAATKESPVAVPEQPEADSTPVAPVAPVIEASVPPVTVTPSNVRNIFDQDPEDDF